MLLARPIDPHWRCVGAGDCCTQPSEIVITVEEAAVLVQHAASSITLQFRPFGDDPHFVALKAHPCPLYDAREKTCTVYAVRPMNCRRFLCMRPNVHTEPFEISGANMMDRVRTSRIARRLAARTQRKAQRWGLAHGWSAS